MRCPNCGETDPLLVDETDDNRVYCAGCRKVTPLEPRPRLIDIPPRPRRDLE